jgi:acetolactate synthase-1/2/3 large subunit
MRSGRPGPVHIEIPTDLMEAPVDAGLLAQPAATAAQRAGKENVERAASLCASAAKPLILAGGGAVWAEDALLALAEKLGAPLVTTANARGLLAGHALSVPASPSLPAIRRLIDDADLVIAVGTQFGPTDYDAYVDGGFVLPRNLIRIDLCSEAEATAQPATLFLRGDARAVTQQLADAVARTPDTAAGQDRAEQARRASYAELSPKMQCMVEVLGAIAEVLPEATLVGDSTQLAYAGNLYWQASGPRHWFNAATGYGALGYGPPAAVGAALGLKGEPVVCLVGDGGFQFCLGALGAAKDESVPVIFVVWNNDGYQEIEDYMLSRGIKPIGVTPSAPDFSMIATAYGIPAQSIRLTDEKGQDALAPGKLDFAPLAAALKQARNGGGGTALIEIKTP